MFLLREGHKASSATWCLFLFGVVFGFLVGKDRRQCGAFNAAKKRSDDASVENARPRLLLVGIMTSKDFVHTRGKAAVETWVKSIPGRVIFFCEEGCSLDTEMSKSVSLVSLPGVKDVYPPQKKSFLMLKYMHDFYLDKFEWFMRADDDAYLIGERLGNFLTSLNTSRPYYIGNAGIGREGEIGKLGLFLGMTYCMGGPGAILSRAALAKVTPHLSYCIKNLRTNHEDTEIGRCINKFVGISCTEYDAVSERKQTFHGVVRISLVLVASPINVTK